MELRRDHKQKNWQHLHKKHLLLQIAWIFFFILSSAATAQTLTGVAVGDSLNTAAGRIGLKPDAKGDFGPVTAIKWTLPDNNELSISAMRATDKIVYIETNWGEWQSGKLTDFSGLLFGETSLNEIRKRFKSNGYMRRPPVTNKDGSIVMFNTYNIEGAANVSITFATKTSVKDGARVHAKQVSLGDVAKLETIIIADNTYLDSLWGTEKLGAYQTIVLSDLVPITIGKKVSLIIGNGAYKFAGRLPNPTNDAQDVASALKKLGFETFIAVDLNASDLRLTLARFTQAASGADVALVYYSGHAIQYRGTNYLIAVDTNLADQSGIQSLINFDLLTDTVRRAKRLRILVLDACRDNPFSAQMTRSTGVVPSRGLAKMDAGEGMIIAFATQSGQTAEDGVGRNSPFTEAFIRHIDSTSEIGAVFRRISAEVFQRTNKSQLPELSLSLSGDLYLRPR